VGADGDIWKGTVSSINVSKVAVYSEVELHALYWCQLTPLKFQMACTTTLQLY
jgi:hypothetical protein